MSSRILIQFGKRVREERTKRGISQERLGELAKVHRTYVGMIERLRKISLLLTLKRLHVHLV